MANIAGYTSTMGAGKRIREVRKQTPEFSYLRRETNRENPAPSVRCGRAPPVAEL